MLGGFIMNLTLKQLFKYGVVCMGVFALNASALDTVSDSFEAPEGSFGLPIKEYKLVVSGAQNEISNFVWYAESGDASTIVSNDAAYADIEGDGPITNDTAELILNLETEGNTLSRTAGVSIASAPVYVDTLIKFTPSEDDPEINMTDVKVALYVNAQSNLVVVHTFYEGGTTPVTTNSVIDGGINPDAWYRLSMEVSTNALALPATRIFVDGTAITHPNAYVPGGASGGGEWFVNTDSAFDVDLISFQGTGLLDELVVSDTAPNFEEPAAILLTLYSPDAQVTFSPVGPVESGTEVTITADEWYRIDSVTGPINETIAGLPAKAVTNVLTAGASCTVTATAAMVSGDLPLGGGTYPAGDVAAWALAQTPPLGETDVTGVMEDDYLMNVAPGTDPVLTITAITVGATSVDVDVTTTAGNLNDVNGTLTLQASDTVDGTYTSIGQAEITIGAGTTTVTVTFTPAGGLDPTDFYKAVVE
jgi:hypothetical protein